MSREHAISKRILLSYVISFGSTCSNNNHTEELKLFKSIEAAYNAERYANSGEGKKDEINHSK